MRGLVIVFVWLMALNASATDTDPAASRSGKVDLQQASLQALKTFNSTPPFIGADLNQRYVSLKGALSAHCEALSSRCVRYVLANRKTVLAQLPSNPAYWASFWGVVSTAPIVNYRYLSMDQVLGKSAPYSLSGVLSAMQQWPLYELASTGEINPQRALLAAQANRARLVHSETLIDRMIFVAAEMRSQHYLGMAMAWAADAGQRDDLARMYAATQTLAPTEFSLRGVLQHELRQHLRSPIPQDISQWEAWAISNSANHPETQAEMLANPPSAAEFEQLKAMLTTMRDTDRVLAELVSLESEQTIVDYWDPAKALSLPEVASTIEGGPEELSEFSWAMVALPAYRDYVRNHQHLALQLIVFRVLADVYLGRSAPGVPPQPAPAFFSWDWRTDEQMLCLVPAADARERAVDVCSYYFDMIWMSQAVDQAQ